MSKPNKTVGRWRTKVGFPSRDRSRPMDEFTAWLVADPERSLKFGTFEKARAAFEQENLTRKEAANV